MVPDFNAPKRPWVIWLQDEKKSIAIAQAEEL